MPSDRAAAAAAVLLLLIGAACTRAAPSALPRPAHVVLYASDWKLTIPVSSAGDGSPDEVKFPALTTYSSQWYYQDHARNTIVFRADVGGARTPGALFSRSELRQMASGGGTQAAWSSDTQAHTMTIRQAITHVPIVHPALVAGQVHGANGYALLIRLDGRRLWVKTADTSIGELDPAYVLDSAYVLGTEFTVTIRATKGHLLVSYDGQPKVDYQYGCRGCYFKVGAYLQTNTDLGDSLTDYGEVAVYDVRVSDGP